MTTFISYARPDAAFALRLATDLRAAEIDVWLDQLDIHAGETWDVAVEQALKRCDTLLVILSPRAVASRAVMDEVSYALEENKRTVPVVLEQCQVPFRIRRLQQTDFTADYDVGLRRLLAAFARPAMPAEEHGPGPDQRTSRDAGGSAPRVGISMSWRTRLLTGLGIGLAGGFFAAVLHILIFAHDPRRSMGSLDLSTTAGLGGLIAGLIWAIAGVVAGPRREPLLGAGILSIVALVVWIASLGTYQDVMSAGVMFGWPVGGVIGAWIGAVIRGRRAQAQGP
jgi:hypothetical protein